MTERFCIPAKDGGRFVARMEAVLDLYARPHDPLEPLVCMDESATQLLADAPATPTLPMTPADPAADEPGHDRRVDDQHERRGTASVFMFFQPFGDGWRRATASERRTKLDWAREVKRLLTEDFADARLVHLLCDNLNTHDVASLYAAFPAAEAHALARRLRVHHTPKHGSWLNVAEVELSVMSRGCLGDRRPGDVATLQAELDAWATDRNAKRAAVQWRFTSEDARIKLHHLYPQL
jgi:hypothetical protein